MADVLTADTARLRLVTIATSLGWVLVSLDVSIVNVGLARIGADFGVGVAGLEWVVDAYALAFASLMLSAGALGDRIGARRGFLLGFGLFTAASLACGLSFDPVALIVARAVQGIGAAAVVPSSLALLNHSFHADPKARARAVGLWTAAGSVAMAAGPALGGLMIGWFGWRSIFLVNLPIGIAGIWMGARWLDETRAGAGSFDGWGQVFGVVTLCSVTAAVIEGGSGWGRPLPLALLAVGLVAGLAFVAVEARAREPMLPLGFFRLPSFSPAVLVGFVINFTLYGAVFVLNLFLQGIAGLSPGRSGLEFLPFPLSLFVANLFAAHSVAKFGSRVPMVAGLCAACAGFAVLSLVAAHGSWLAMLPAVILMTAGIGTAVPAMTSALLGSVPPGRSGVASGVLNTARQAGGAIGVALFGGFFATGGAAGMGRAFGLASVMLAGAVVLALVGIKAKAKN